MINNCMYPSHLILHKESSTLYCGILFEVSILQLANHYKVALSIYPNRMHTTTTNALLGCPFYMRSQDSGGFSSSSFDFSSHKFIPTIGNHKTSDVRPRW